MISSIANLVYELPNNLRLRILGNKEILAKSQIWVETQPSTQSPFQKLNFASSSQKTRKSRYQTFLVLSNFTEFLYLVSNILPRIVGLSNVDHERKHKLIIDIWMLNMNTFNFTLYSISFILESSLLFENIFYTKTVPN